MPPPEPQLTADEMIERARRLRPILRARQADCEASGNVPDDVNAELIRAGFYRIVQPRRFGGYEFDVPSFYRVMMEIARGCAETGWVLALTAGHPLLAANLPEQGQREIYGTTGDFRCPAAFTPPGTAHSVDGGYRVSGSWPSASGIDHSTHFFGAAVVQGTAAPGPVIHLVLDRDQYRIVDDWQVMGMQGTGSKRVVADNIFVPTYRTLEALALGRGAEPVVRAGLYDNPMYFGRVAPFLIGEAAAVATGAARGALDLYEELLRNRTGPFPPYLEHSKNPEFQRYYGEALALIATAEAALIRVGEDFMEFARQDATGGEPFDDEKAERVTLIEQQCIRLAWEAVDLIYRTAGTSASAKQGQPIGRAFRCLAVINTHPALQLDRTAVSAARTRFGLQPATVARSSREDRNGPSARTE